VAGAGVILGILLSLVIVVMPGAATFSGANGKIAYSAWDGVGSPKIWVMNADGSGQTKLTNYSDDGPAWSANGQKIAFYSFRDGNAEIYVMNADGSGQTRLTNNAAREDCPAWSPDGQKIAFTSDRNGPNQIYVMNADGSQEQRLTTTAQGNSYPAWSPNGQKIAFTSSRDGNWEIYVMNADGTNQQRITNNSREDSHPKWAPDGQKIVFDSRDTSADIYTINADGSGENRLTNESGAEQFPTWSPDGQKIAFSTTRDGIEEIYAMNTNGSGLTRLTLNSTYDKYPDWQAVVAPTPTATLSTTYFTVQSSTPIGNNVSVSLGSNTNVTFGQILSGGTTTLATTATGPAIPSGFSVGNPPVYYDISTMAPYAGAIDVCITYDPNRFGSQSGLALYHYENGAWRNVTTSVNTNTHVICGRVTSLSPFAIMMATPAEAPEPGSLLLLAGGLASLGGWTAFRSHFGRQRDNH
jgi:TolB protein